MRIRKPDAVKDLQTVAKPGQFEVKFAQPLATVQLVADEQRFTIEFAVHRAQIISQGQRFETWQ